MLSILLVIVILSLLIIAHELGHFITARRNGVKVDEFGIGFPPKLYGRKSKAGTLYSINLLPLGGFVRLHGEDSEDSSKGSFSAKPYKVKAKIVLAGVAVNLIIAYFIIYILMVTGLPALLPNGPVAVGPIKPTSVVASPLLVRSVSKDSAAQRAGITPGTEVLAINNTTLVSYQQMQDYTKSNAGKTIELTIRKDGKTSVVATQLGTDSTKGYLGLAGQVVDMAYYNPLVAILAAGIALFQLALATISAFGGFILGLFTQAQVSDGVAGPVGIVSIFGSVVQFGWKYVLIFVASISLSLAVINLLPLPALDGGRFAIMTLARLGVKISPSREALMHWLGFGFLIILAVIITISDISRL